MLLLSGSVFAQEGFDSISEEDGSIGTFKYESEEDLKEETIQEEEDFREDEDEITTGDSWRGLDDGEDTVLETEHE